MPLRAPSPRRGGALAGPQRPDLTTALIGHGNGVWVPARRSFLKTYELDPKNVMILNNLAFLFKLSVHSKAPTDTVARSLGSKLWFLISRDRSCPRLTGR